MKYKQGDEVFIKAEITDVHEGCEKPYFVHPNLDSLNWVSEEKVFPADKTYEMGLNDAWELAKKLLSDEEDGGLDLGVLKEIFGTVYMADIVNSFTPQETLTKIEAYEKEKSEIKVGDVIEYKNTLKAVVTRIENCDEVYVLWGDGSCGKMKKNEALKSGKTAEGLTDLLRQIGE